jgi:hypothetical protein
MSGSRNPQLLSSGSDRCGPVCLKLWTGTFGPPRPWWSSANTSNPLVFSNCGRIARRPQLSEKRGRERAFWGWESGSSARSRPQPIHRRKSQNAAAGARRGATAGLPGGAQNSGETVPAGKAGGGNRPRIETLSASDEVGGFDLRYVRSSRRTQDRTLSASDGVGEFRLRSIWPRTRFWDRTASSRGRARRCAL